MCFDLDSRPPIAPIAGGALDSARLMLTADDGTRFAAFRARATEPTGAGIVILPDVRGLHPYYEELALRFAEHGIDALAIDYFGRTAGAEAARGRLRVPAPRGADDVGRARGRHRRAAAHLRRRPAARCGPCSPSASAWADGCRSWPRRSDLELAGVIGFYGSPVGPSRNDTPAPADMAGAMEAPVLGIFGGADQGIPPSSIAEFEAALAAAGVDHRLVTYPGAPHSFFDRKATEFAAASAAAWEETLAFIRAQTAAPD